MITRSIPHLPEYQPTLLDDLNGTVERQSDPNSVDRLAELNDLREAINHFNSMDASGVRTENNPADTAARRRNTQQAEHDLAFGHFARAYLGAAALRIEGVYEPNSPQYKESWTEFQYFKRKYGSPRKEADRTAYWKQLTNQIAELEGGEAQYELFTGLDRRSPSSEQYPKQLGKGDELELTLTTREKLQALQADDRARFLPTSHREKTAALSLLNYMDAKNPLFSTRHDTIDKQLSEIYDHQIKESNKKYEAEKQAAKDSDSQDMVVKNPIDHARQAQEIAIDSVRSVINEWDDYRSNALYSLNELGVLLDLAISHGNPKTTLAELMEQSELSIDPQPILRYLDLVFFRDKGELPSFDPLLTREIRPAPPEFTSKNKIVIDSYLNSADKEKHATEFEIIPQAISVKALRELLPEAVRDSMRRYSFFNRAINGVTGPYKVFAEQTTRTKAA